MSPDRWKKIEDVFVAAAELGVHERTEFLDRECNGDAEFRNEVEKLLAGDESSNDFISLSVWADSDLLNTNAKRKISSSFEKESETDMPDNMIGKEIGAYRLIREIGRGGMGAVYLAERADGEFRQSVAIKLIKRGMDSDFIVRRFRHERQILASFEHPFIARLLDGGTTSDSIPYFVMEYIEGDTLYNYCDFNKLTVTERLKIFRKVCTAIDYAHQRQIIHRDIKPGNILINNAGVPKLLDFGIAKILDPNLIHESLNPTASMLMMMTPDYASPEQMQGIEVTPSSDIYSLGVLLYELLTGRKPYDFAGYALHEISHMICEVNPELPSRSLQNSSTVLSKYAGSTELLFEARKTDEAGLEQLLSGDLDNIVMKAMAKNQADRYVSVCDLAEDISGHLSGKTISAPRFTEISKKRTENFFRTPENSRTLAVLPFKFLNLGSESDTDHHFLGLGLADALITRLSKIKRFVVRPTSSILSFGEGQIDPIRAGSELRADYILDGNIKKANNRLRVTVQLLNVADNAAVWATSIDEMLSDVLTLEDTLSNKVIEALLPQLSGSELAEFTKRGTDIPEAFEHYLRGRYQFNNFTEDGLAKSFVSFHKAIAADPNYALAFSGIADYYNWLGIIGVLPPQECFQPAIEAATRAVELDGDLSEAHSSLGFSLHAGNYDWSRAEHHLLRALELNPSNANAYVWYSIVLYTEGRFAEGLEFAKRSVDLDPLTPFNHHNIGWGLYYARRYEEAIKQYRKVVADFPEYSFGYYGLSKIYRITRDTKQAIRENDKAMELMGTSVFSLLSEAECYAADGQADAALAKINELEKLALSRYVSPYQLALAYCYLGDKENAIESLEKAAEIKEAWLNWMGVEPAFDPIRNDERFDTILEKIRYRMFFKNFAASGTNLIGVRRSANRVDSLSGFDRTTLVIDETHVTDAAGFTPKGPLFGYASATVLLLGLAIGAYFVLPRLLAEPMPVLRSANFQNPSVVVLPFACNDPANEHLGIGLADAFTNRLGNIKGIQVMSASTGRFMAGQNQIRAANDLGVMFVLRGTLNKTDSGSSLDAELFNAAAGHVVWKEHFNAPNGDYFSLQTKIAERLWKSLNIEPLPLERRQVEKSYTQNFDAYEKYLIGRSQMANRDAEGLRRAIALFAAAVKEDAEFAPAYVGLADAHSLLNLYDINPPEDAYPRAKEFALRALAIDDDLAEAHASLAYIKFYYERDRSAAELEFRRAIQMNPSYAQAHHWFALVLAAMNKPVDALSEIQMAERHDPRSMAIKSAAGIIHFFAGQYPQAIAECDKALALDSRFVPAHKVKRWVYAAMGNWEAARESLERERLHSGGNAEDPGWQVIASQIAPLEGDGRADSLAMLEEAIRSDSVRGNDFTYAFEIALAFNYLGQTEKALDWLERSEAAGTHSFNLLEADPRLANLRREPRFERLVRKLYTADRR